MATPLILALGGTRSGKSRFGLATTRRLAARRPRVVPRDRATRGPRARRSDPQAPGERSAEWPTIDVGGDLAAAIAATEPAEPILIDGLTLWLAMLLGDGAPAIDPILDGPVAQAYGALAARPGAAIVVSDEVGLGIVPMHANARAYRDLVGIAHQRLAAMADEAYLFVAGLPVTLKGPR
jgi:adenosylcobinamide kinase/adenosylcobinamide-phosphate guanylyltransferase